MLSYLTQADDNFTIGCCLGMSLCLILNLWVTSRKRLHLTQCPQLSLSSFHQLLFTTSVILLIPFLQLDVTYLVSHLGNRSLSWKSIPHKNFGKLFCFTISYDEYQRLLLIQVGSWAQLRSSQVILIAMEHKSKWMHYLASFWHLIQKANTLKYWLKRKDQILTSISIWAQ